MRSEPAPNSESRRPSARHTLFAVAVGLSLLPAVLSAQFPLPSTQPADEAVPADQTTDTAEPVEPPPMAAYEVVPRVAELEGEAEGALARIDELAAAESAQVLERAVAEATDDQAALEARLSQLLRTERRSPWGLRELAEEVELHRERVASLAEQADERLRLLDALRSEWRTELERWQTVAADLSEDPRLAEVYGDTVDGALATARRVVGRADEVLPELVAPQQRLQTIAAAARRLDESTSVAVADWRAHLFEASEPGLFSGEFLDQVSAATSGGVEAVVRPSGDLWLASLEGSNGERAAGLLGLVLLGTLLAGLAVRWAGRRVGTDSRWSWVAERAWSIGLLACLVALFLVIGALPALLRLILSLGLAVAVARITARMLKNPYKRRLAYGILGVYVVLTSVQILGLPTPLYRALQAALVLAAVPALALLAWANQRSGRSGWFSGSLWGAVGVLSLVLVAEALGFHPLAHFLLDATVNTAFLVFVTVFLIRLGAAAIHGLLGERREQRSRFLGQLPDDLAPRLEWLLKVVLVGVAVLYGAVFWGLASSVGEAWTSLVEAGVSLGEDRGLTVGQLLWAALAMVLAFLASSVLRALLSEQVFERRDLDRGVRDSISTLLHYVLVVLGLFFALSLLGLDLSSVALLAGALGVGIGFGLQGVVGNFFSGLVLLFERPIRVGDVVVVADQWGTVEKIGLRSTVVQTFDRSEIIVPNIDMITEKVVNWTLSSRSARLSLEVSVAYGTDPEQVLALLTEIAAAHPDSLEEPPPVVTFERFGSSSLDFMLRVWVADIERRLIARTEIATAIVRRFGDEGIVIPFPQLDVRLPGGVPGPPSEPPAVP